MKKILIPALLTTSIVPMVSMISCGEDFKPAPEEKTIVIDGIPSEQVQGTVASIGTLDVTIWMIKGDRRENITHDADIVFTSGISSSLSYVKQYGQIMWNDDITSGSYPINFVATYDNINSDEYTLNLYIKPRQGGLQCYGTKSSYEAKLNTEGKSDKISIVYVDPFRPVEIDVTSQVITSITASSSCLWSWDPTGYMCWTPTKSEVQYRALVSFDYTGGYIWTWQFTLYLVP